MIPALSPGCGRPVSISLGYTPSLHHLRRTARRTFLALKVSTPERYRAGCVRPTYLARGHDPTPGNLVIGRGVRRIDDLVLGAKLEKSCV